MSIIHDNYFEFDILCNDIANLDNDVEFVAVLNHKGRVIETKARENGIDKILTMQKKEMFFMQCVLQISMNRDHDDEFGKVKSSILERERSTTLLFEFFNYVILVVSRPGLNPIQLKNSIMEKMNNIKKADLVC
ncbi:DUF6659 family protein [Candidatus Nitrosotalea okcheonensis]|uniref:Roadblock/LAMTOR2 domain-containing protein n=1 Tax=Candidatus Nitrosotalea okcheonensis TaxID=1903276 RepID=A0A2H1FBY5_9ARCH|nr:DUF6659 family protein [Candidatus Nitrosotalea okcheonensis]SMH70271.1 protein of unknown function [Candidatus Nitrosotalea okcheonensis]